MAALTEQAENDAVAAKMESHQHIDDLVSSEETLKDKLVHMEGINDSLQQQLDAAKEEIMIEYGNWRMVRII